MHLPTFRSHLSTVLQMHFSQEALRYAPSHLSFSSVHCPPNAFLSRGFTLGTFPPLSSVHCPPNAFFSGDFTLCTFPPFSLICPLSSECISLKRLYARHLSTFRSHLSTVLQMHFSQESLHYAPSYLSFSFVHCPPNACLSRDFTLCTFPPFALMCPLSSKCMSLKRLYAMHLPTFRSHLSTVLQMHVSQETLPLCTFPPFALICPLSSKCISLKRLYAMHLPTFRSHLSTVLQMHFSQEALRYAPSHLSLSSVHCPPNARLSMDSPNMHLPNFIHFKPTFFVRSEVTPVL